MRIQLPDPSDMTVEQWFAQIRIVLKSAEKMYQQMVKDYGKSDEGGNNPWVLFKLDDELSKNIQEGACPAIEDDFSKCIYLDVNHL